MLALAAIATVLALAPQSDCSETFYALYNMSSKMANDGKYAEAAALREASGHLFQDCLDQKRAPREGMYPFDGVGAYLIAATFWRLAGENTEAMRDLRLGETALQVILKRYPISTLTDAQRLELAEMQRLIHDDESGKWAVWKQ